MKLLSIFFAISLTFNLYASDITEQTRPGLFEYSPLIAQLIEIREDNLNCLRGDIIESAQVQAYKARRSIDSPFKITYRLNDETSIRVYNVKVIEDGEARTLQLETNDEIILCELN